MRSLLVFPVSFYGSYWLTEMFYLCMELKRHAHKPGDTQTASGKDISGAYADDTLSANDFAMTFVHAGEYGKFVTVDRRFIMHMEEKMQCVIAENAIKVLSELEQ